MSSEIKYLIFKGVSKKEQILLKSYLNLAKNELPYQIIVLNKEREASFEPNFVISDELYKFKGDEQNLLQLPQIVIGQDVESKRSHYLSKPIRWSDFKLALTDLGFQEVSSVDGNDSGSPADSMEVELGEASVGALLPTNVKLSVEEPSLSQAEEGDLGVDLQFSGQEQDFELGKFSVDYDSFTNSEYARVVDDVNQFNEDQQGSEAVLLVSDDESSFTSSVLVLESDAADVWDYDEEEDYEFSQMIDNSFSETNTEEDSTNEGKGILISPGEEIWLDDNEIIAEGKTVLFIKKKRRMVYSTKAPGRWPEHLNSVEVYKSEISESWTPFSGLKAYPISHLIWACELARSDGKLRGSLEPEAYYLLQKWPSFELIHLDNKLMKLATLLFIGVESCESLVSKTNYKKGEIVGFLNACDNYGILKPASQEDISNLKNAQLDGSVLNKIKKVFQ